MKRRLLDYLACPACGGELDLQGAREDGSEVIAGCLHCPSCVVCYAIIEGIPRFVPAALDAEKKKTATAFGYSWTQFSELRPEYERQFLDWIAPVTAEFFRDKAVLDAGCGKGRHLSCAADFGARDVIGVDLSDAVESAYRNIGHLPNAHVVQGDIYHLPFRPGTFDYGYSIGVLHHLPDPRAGFHALLPFLRPGGRVSAWVYGRENNGWIVHLISPLRHALTARLPQGVLKFACGLATAATLIPMLKLIYGPVNRWLPPLRRFLFYNDYLAYIAEFPFREIHSIVFDHLVAPTAHYLTREEFAEWFARDNLREISIGWHNRNSWRGTAVVSAARFPGVG